MNDHEKSHQLINGIAEFQRALLQLVENTKTELFIYSKSLPTELFSQPEIVSAISKMARQHKLSCVRILIPDSRALPHQTHALLELQKKLPSKITCRQLITTEPENPKLSFVTGDKKHLLFQHEHDSLSGFIDNEAAPQAQKLLEEYKDLWERHSSDIPDLKQFRL